MLRMPLPPSPIHIWLLLTPGIPAASTPPAEILTIPRLLEAEVITKLFAPLLVQVPPTIFNTPLLVGAGLGAVAKLRPIAVQLLTRTELFMELNSPSQVMSLALPAIQISPPPVTSEALVMLKVPLAPV